MIAEKLINKVRVLRKRNPQDHIFENLDMISKRELREIALPYLKNRTIDFYVREGILKKGTPHPTDQRIFWRRDYILDEIKAIDIFSRFGLTLKQIAQIAAKTGFNLRGNVEEFVNIIETYLERKKLRFQNKKYSKLVSNQDAFEIIQGFYEFVKTMSIISKDDIERFKRKVQDYERVEIEIEKIERAAFYPEELLQNESQNKILENFKNKDYEERLKKVFE